MKWGIVVRDGGCMRRILEDEMLWADTMANCLPGFGRPEGRTQLLVPVLGGLRQEAVSVAWTTDLSPLWAQCPKSQVAK